MHTPAKLLFDLSYLCSHALTDRRASHPEPPMPVLPTDTVEAQEIEPLRFPFSLTANANWLTQRPHLSNFSTLSKHQVTGGLGHSKVPLRTTLATLK